MATSFTSKLKHAWNAFLDKESDFQNAPLYGGGSSYSLRPDRPIFTRGNERSILASIYTRIAIDVASVSLRHVRLDKSGRYQETLDTGLNRCLTLSGNVDQTGRALRQDMVQTMLDKGVIAVVAVDTTLNPTSTGGYDVGSLRVGEVVQWFPQHVRISLYNDRTGLRQEVTLPKSVVAIIENPLYSIMNEHNSTLQRLKGKLNLLDTVENQASSGKLDLIVQLPYVIKSEARRAEAERRRGDIETQLKGSQYGIAYTDGTERVTQLNRPATNNLLDTVKFLTEMLYTELGLTTSVMDGTADEKTMLNYQNRTVEPILGAIADGLKRTFLTQTARTQGQSVEYFREPFKLVPITSIADVADKLTRNEVLTSNEVRGLIGFAPASDPNADKLLNKNMPTPAGSSPPQGPQ